MKPEATLSTLLCKRMRPFGDVFSFIKVETGITIAGVCDINYAYTNKKRGWIELKVIKKPKTTTLPKWTALQRLFAKRRIAAGEKCFLFLKAGEHHFLFNASDIVDIKKFTFNDLIRYSVGYWNGDYDAETFWNLL